MTSSMAGDRRWASARRGGLTVLGKVAVPKPLNLPSQRLENHGLNPNIEIVPKGTLSWGSSTSSSTSNAWGSSTQSPNDDGGSSLPSHLSAHPSSGGSGTRPYTAGSDRKNEPPPNTWGTSSRPSSASGALSSETSPLLHPRSAETRPSSSQLSRFAGPVSEHSTAWGAAATAEQLGVMSLKNEGFSLTSGDFPMLGSDIDVSGKTAKSQDHGSDSCTSLASGEVVQSREKITASNPDFNGGKASEWRSGGQNAEDGPPLGMEKWQGEPYQYFGPNVPPQHFDTWRGPPMNGPAAVWYRGPPGGPQYGASVPPGGFPIEPCPYFRPQIPPHGHTSSPPVPPPGAGPREHHPRGGELYRPQIPDAFMRPGMPFRPGFYPGPMAFEGYYGPPMGYCSSNERDIPLLGMPPGPPVYNRYPGSNNPNPSNSYARNGGHGSDTKAFPERVASADPDNAKRPYKALLKPDARQEGENWENLAPANGPYPGRIGSLQKQEGGAMRNGEEELYSRRTTWAGETYMRSYDNCPGGYFPDNTTLNSFEGIDHMKGADGSSSKKSGSVGPSMRKSSSVPEKDSLMQKIESLNAKVRASDGCYDASYASSEGGMNKSQINSKVNNSTNQAGDGPISSERTLKCGNTLAASQVTIGNKGGQSTTAMSRRPHGEQSGSDDHGKSGVSSHSDSWGEKPMATEFSNVASATSIKSPLDVHACGSAPGGEVVGHAVTNVPGRDEKESLPEFHDAADNQAQLAKRKELARQRALQLQKEEEERIREQKAKALAKLEELNRRMQAGDASSRKAERAPRSDVTKQGLDKSSTPKQMGAAVKPQAEAARSDVEASDLYKKSESTNPSARLQTSAPKLVQSETVIAEAKVLLPKQDVHTATATDGKFASQSSDAAVVKHKHSGYKHRPDTVQKNSNKKSALANATETSKDHNDVVNNDSPLTALPEVGPHVESNMNSSTKFGVESSVQQRRKSYRTSKNKPKLDDASSGPASPTPVLKESNPAKALTQHEKSDTLQPVGDRGSVQPATGGGSIEQPSEQISPLPTEVGHGGVVNQRKPQHPPMVQGNQNSNRFTDKFHGSDTTVRASVHSQRKTQDANEGSQKTVPDSVCPLKNDKVAQSNSKSKRTEIERYIPKPVAKELAEQGSTQQPMLTSSSHTGTEQRTVSAEPRSENSGDTLSIVSETENVGFTRESPDRDRKHNNRTQGKGHGMWRQRGLAEMALDHGKDTDMSLDQTQSFWPEGEPIPCESKCSGELNTSDGWNMPGDSAGLLTTSSFVKTEGKTVKGWRFPSKGNRSAGNTGHDHKKTNWTLQNHTQSGQAEVTQMDVTVAAKGNSGMGNRTPHWQLKSHMLPIKDQQVGGSSGVQNVTVEGGWPNKNDHYHKVHFPPCDENENTNKGLCEPVQSEFKSKTVVDVPNVGIQNPRRERQPTTFRGHPHLPNQGPADTDESASTAIAEDQQEQNFSSGFRMNDNQNKRFSRSQESRGDGSSVQDNRQHNFSSGQGRRRINMNNEYRPVGEYNNIKSKTFEGPADGSHNIGPRQRDRDQIQSKRGGGNFHRRQGGSAHANASYE